MEFYIVLLLCMIFCHILDDFVLQAACLNKLKQRDFWKQNAPDEKYRFDFIAALAVHSFSWAFMIMLVPIVYTFFLILKAMIILLDYF